MMRVIQYIMRIDRSETMTSDLSLYNIMKNHQESARKELEDLRRQHWEIVGVVPVSSVVKLFDSEIFRADVMAYTLEREGESYE